MKRIICRKESKSKQRAAGPGVPVAEIPDAPNIVGMLLAHGAHTTQELGGSANQEPGLPQDSRKHLLAHKLVNYGKKLFCWETPVVATICTLHPPPWLADWGCDVPHGAQMLVQKAPSTQRVPSQNGIISLADQSTMCFLLGFPWRGGKRSAKLLPIPPSWCLGTTRYLKQ